ncbi:lytic polysaccharide monooxygenase [Micromonospora sp. NPDC023814]|uniref:lytic polysaccharide monooxygenase n=1 Tax=Micromonospora sp. NPDC023814 TaxID=3154596 RepID=UPI0033D29A93
MKPGAFIASAVLAGTAVLVGVISMGNPQASAHGSMQSPPSRIYLCYQEGPEAPRSDGCKAVKAAGGAQAMYDWNGVLISNAAGRHREIVPDGELCSAGNPVFKGLDLPRADWTTTSLPSSGNYQFLWEGTAPHNGVFEFYVTKDGYDPSQPLAWSSLEAQPFLRAEQPPLEGGLFKINGKLPDKRGRHLIYTIYQRSDSPEAFYACSDVVFGDGGAPVPVSPAPQSPSPTGSPSPEQPSSSEPPRPIELGEAPGDGASPGPPHTHSSDPNQPAPQRQPSTGVTTWLAGTTYATGAQVSYQGVTYVAALGHTAQLGWEPPRVPGLWHAVPVAGSGGVPSWQVQVSYAVGAHVSYQGVVYMCRQGHTALPGWEPTRTPALWEPMV